VCGKFGQEIQIIIVTPLFLKKLSKPFSRPHSKQKAKSRRYLIPPV